MQKTMNGEETGSAIDADFKQLVALMRSAHDAEKAALAEYRARRARAWMEFSASCRRVRDAGVSEARIASMLGLPLHRVRKALRAPGAYKSPGRGVRPDRAEAARALLAIGYSDEAVAKALTLSLAAVAGLRASDPATART